MVVLIETLSILWQTITSFFLGLGKSVVENLPSILEFKKVIGYFTPEGMIALSIGVPTVFVTVTIKLIKKFVQSR